MERLLDFITHLPISQLFQGPPMHYSNVQALRAIAASFVVIGHASGFYLIKVPDALALLGYTGVDIFFVISGFIICHAGRRSAEASGTRLGNALEFLTRRYWRIFPLYWIVLCFAVGLSKLGIAPSAGMEDLGHLQYILLFAQSNKFVPPAWTLTFELYFYTMFAVVILVAPQRMFIVIAVVMLGHAAAAYFAPNLDVVASPLILEFGLGCFVAWMDHKRLHGLMLVSLVLGAALICAGDVQLLRQAPEPPDAMMRLATFGLGSAFILHALVSAEKRGIRPFPTWLLHLGDASYSLYLWHYPLIILAVWFNAGSLVVPFIFVFAIFSYRWVELPILSLAKRFFASQAYRTAWAVQTSKKQKSPSPP